MTKTPPLPETEMREFVEELLKLHQERLHKLDANPPPAMNRATMRTLGLKRRPPTYEQRRAELLEHIDLERTWLEEHA